MGSGEEFPPAKGTCLPKADLPLGVNQSQKAMREVFPFNTSLGNSETLPLYQKYCPKSKYKTSKLCPVWN